MRRLLLSFFFIVSSALTSADDAPERRSDLIHSDVPLWGSFEENVWPWHFFDDDGSFGCAHSTILGDWRLYGPHDEPKDGDWYRFDNYGVFHCYLIVSAAHEQQRLGTAHGDYSLLIKIDQTKRDGETLDLWALQMGARPGSRYLLLAAKPTGQLIDTFQLLQTRCPRGKSREGPSLDALLTDYCAINSKRDMRRLAKDMAKLPPLGRLSFVGD